MISNRKITGKLVPWWDVVSIIRPYTSDPYPAKRLQYLLPDADTIRYLLHKSKAWKYEYDKETRTCDDACNIFKGFLSRKGLGHILAMKCRIKKPAWDDAHEAIGFLRDGVIRFGEPQTASFPAYHDAPIQWVSF